MQLALDAGGDEWREICVGDIAFEMVGWLECQEWMPMVMPYIS